MSQRINFYSEKYRPRVDYLSLNHCASYLTFMMALIAVALTLQYVSQRSMTLGISELEADVGEWNAQIAELKKVIVARAKDPRLESAVSQLESEQKDKLTLRQFLQQEVPGNVVGFSQYLESLARYHVSGLRLTRIALGSGGESIKLTGEVLSGELVTNYLDGLGQSQIFSGRQFRQLKLERINAEEFPNQLPDGQSLIFEVSTVGRAGE